MLFCSQISRQGLQFIMFRGRALSCFLNHHRAEEGRVKSLQTFDLFVLFLFPRTSFLYLMIWISHRLSQRQSFKFLNEMLTSSKHINILLGRRAVLSTIPLPLLDFTLVSKTGSRLRDEFVSPFNGYSGEG